jgi:hypothetical protein
MISTKFPKDISDTMKDCILAILWPREQIVEFFKNNGCVPNDIKEASRYKEIPLNRAQIIDVVFSSLYGRNDGGLGQFRAILKSLMDWEYFDPYYFKELKKLDEMKARRLISQLRQLQEIRDARIKENKQQADKHKTEIDKNKKSLAQIRDTFLSLFSQRTLTHQQRGYKLEEILRDIAVFECLDVSEPFKIKGEQIDGSLKFDGEHYIIEAKWHDKQTASDALYHFAHKIEGKLYGRGFFISVNCFSSEAILALRSGKALKTILIDGGDLTLVVEGHLTFSQMLDAKIKAAQTQGRIYVDPLTAKEKIT